MNERIGIILGGGGGKGAYQAGIWKALEKLDAAGRITGVSGASIGALNGALFCIGGLDQAIRAWGHVSEEMILQPRLLNDGVIRNYNRREDYNGWFTNEGIIEMLEQYADLAAIRDSPRSFYAVASRVRPPALLYEYVKTSSQKGLLNKAAAALYLKLLALAAAPRYFYVNKYQTDMIRKIILASSAIPFVFPDITIEGNIYVDGGLDDNVPILPLYRDGFRRLLVIALDSDYQLPVKDFPDAVFLSFIMPDGDGLKGLASTFDFTAKSAKIKMRQGYDDAMARREEIRTFFR